MKPHYYEVIADLRFRITKATEELTLLDVAHNQIATRRVELQTNIAGMNELAEELEEFIAQTEPPTTEPEEAKPFRLEVGKRYVRRDGCNTDPLISNGEWFHDPSEPTYLYHEDGHFHPHTEDWRDLVAEYVEPPKEWEFFQASGGQLWAVNSAHDRPFFFSTRGYGWLQREPDYALSSDYIRTHLPAIPNLPPGIPMP